MSPLDAIALAAVTVLIILVAVGVWRRRKDCWTVVADEPHFVVIESSMSPAHARASASACAGAGAGAGASAGASAGATPRLMPGRGAAWGEITTTGVPQGSAWAPGQYF